MSLYDDVTEPVHVVRAVCPEDWGSSGPPGMTYERYEAEIARWNASTHGGGLWDEDEGGPWDRAYPRSRAAPARSWAAQLAEYLRTHQVPDKWWQVWLHHYEDGKTLEETADTLSLSLASVRRYMAQLRRAATGVRPTARTSSGR